MHPFWQGEWMENESLLMVADGDSLPEASLLFEPDQIRSVRSARLDREYVEGRDWILDQDKLIIPSGSEIPVMKHNELYLPDYIPGESMPRKGGGAVLYREGSYFHDRQIVVSYTHKPGLWNGPKPEFAAHQLAGSIARLQSGKPLKLVLYGDSISVGANSSGYSKVPPYLPIWGELTARAVEEAYGTKVEFDNPSVGGTTSDWGVEHASTLVTDKNPDLVIIAFGMNDGSGAGAGDGTDPEIFKGNIASIMHTVRTVNPQAEFILVATTLPNEETFFLDKQPYYYRVLEQLAAEGEGITVANMTGVHEELLKRKKFRDMTGNHINHPNDFLARWHAQFIAGLLIDYDKE